MGWIYPHVDEPLLWACDRRYFFKGQFVLEVKGGNIFDTPTVITQDGFESLTLSSVDMKKLRERNEDSMFIIEHEAMDFINQTS
jgi:phosphoadenosine phosphosulfate reductase